MECRKIQKLLIAWLDHETNQAQPAAITTHLSSCKKCYLIASQYEKLNALLPTGNVVLPQHIHYRILDQVKMHDVVRSRNKVLWRLEALPTSLLIILTIYFGALIGKVFENKTDKDVSTYSEYVNYGEHTILALNTNGVSHE